MTTARLDAATATRSTVAPLRAPWVQATATALAVVLLVILSRDGHTTFSLSSASTGLTIPPIRVEARLTGVVTVLVAAAITAVCFLRATRGARVPLWLTTVFTLDLVIGFLAWAAAGHTLPIVGLLTGTLALSVPLIFGALGGVLSERVGVVNVAIEGQLLAGAFTGAVIGSITRSAAVGFLAAAIAGMLVSFVLAAFSIRYLVDQVIVGVVLNVFVLGLTNFLFSGLLAKDTTGLNTPPQLPVLGIPLLSQIPVIGPVLFQQTALVYLMYIGVAVVTVALFRTPWGLRVRAVGEHPRAADTVGINVRSIRFRTVSLAGAVAGVGGAYFTLVAVPAFSENVTSGVGYIALAAVIFGGWNPVKATLAALLFGFASNLQNVLGIVGSPVPSNFLLMLPYVVTLIAVAGLAGSVRAPAASGKPYTSS